jgi:O-6-methylguanine DNA methyltransferase
MISTATNIAYWTPFTTPLGTAYIASTRRGICRLSLPQETDAHFFVGLDKQFSPDHVRPHPEPNMEAIAEIDAYWKGERTRFELRLDLQGTAFQKAIWHVLLQVPFGKTITYRELADIVDNPRGYQAVGAAVGQNPIRLVVPCHRVLGADGALTGFVSGAQTKRWLLQHEGALLL